jgi:hypothetical protein
MTPFAPGQRRAGFLLANQGMPPAVSARQDLTSSCNLHVAALACYRALMSVHLQIRDMPDKLHRILRRRASARGLSLRQYTLEVLREHCRQPTLDEWLDGLSKLTPVLLSRPTATAIHEAREAEDAALIDVLGRS